MTKIIRTPTRVAGGITPDEKVKLDAHAALWIKRALRTEPIDPKKIVPAIEGLYAAAGLKRPRVVIVPSPLVMAFAYGAAAAIWYKRDATRAATASATRSATGNATLSATGDATASATASATDDATYSATDSATDNATRRATRVATASATDDATRRATDDATASAEIGAALACRELAGELGLTCATRWSNAYQGGNMWAVYDCYLTAMRDVLGLRLPEHAKYAFWEQAAIEGGFRVMHPEFCMVSDFPEVLKIDAENRPHCADGPSHRWRDGWSLYHWHGVRVPSEWIEDKANLAPAAVLRESNLERRRAGIEILGWHRVLRELGATVIDEHPNPEYGALVEVQLPDLPTRSRFLHAQCGTKREFAMGVPNEIASVIEAQAWLTGLPEAEFEFPKMRT